VAAAPRVRFSALWRRLDAAGDGADVFEGLAAAYAEEGRAYHTMEHVTDCLARLDEAPAVSGSRNLIEAAIWFHDVVYDPHRTDNERLSAEWAGRALTAAGIPGPTVSRVQELVRATEHAREPVDDTGRLLSDIDLSILGREPMAFDEYQRRIREEYAWMPEPDYRRGRTRVLTAFLERPHLYFTDHFRDRYELPARLNLRRALADLAS
jgi:predicted metal-dependent HD superfamily phosphohydrolase